MNGLFGLVGSGVFSSGPVRVGLVVGAVVAIASSIVGIVTVIRGQSFAGHSLSDIGTTGGSGAFLVGVNPLWGFLVIAMAAAGLMEAFGLRRPRDRDLATGIVLGAALGIAALFLYLDANSTSTTGATMTVLFGSLFAISSSIVPVVAGLCFGALVIVFLFFRQLMLCAMDPDMAVARGVRLRLVSVLYLVALAVSVSLSCLTIGAILSTALLIGPAAASLRIVKRPIQAMATAALIGVFSTTAGVILAYESFYWPPKGRGWPASFFVVAIVFVCYLATGAARSVTDRRQRRSTPPAPLLGHRHLGSAGR